METPGLATAAYWESDEVDIRLNPRRGIDASGLRGFLEKECGVKAAVVMATSGSSGGFKFAVLPKSVLLASARAVVEHCAIRKDDVWLAGLSDFHVGGMGIYARAYVAGSRVETLNDKRWQRDGRPFLDAIVSTGATLTSMTPTHLYDVVKAEEEAPPSLRGVLLGGARIEASLVSRAQKLGWRIWPSYGMTEACSQIATSIDGDCEWLPILPHWKCRLSAGGQLEIRGEALFAGYAERVGDRWRFETARSDGGWFTTGDRCEVSDRHLRFLGRADDLVKVSGELVSLSAVEAVAADCCGHAPTALIALPDERRGNTLIVFVESSGEEAAEALTKINGQLDGIENVSRIFPVGSLPRTEIGKIDRQALLRMATEEPG